MAQFDAQRARLRQGGPVQSCLGEHRRAAPSNERPYVSDSYQFALEGAGQRAEMLGGRGLPADLPTWIDSPGQENVRALSKVRTPTEILNKPEKLTEYR